MGSKSGEGDNEGDEEKVKDEGKEKETSTGGLGYLSSAFR